MLLKEFHEDDVPWDEERLISLGDTIKKDPRVKGIVVHDNGINFRRVADVFKLKADGTKLEMYFVDYMNKARKIRSNVRTANDVLRAAIFINDHGQYHPVKEALGDHYLGDAEKYLNAVNGAIGIGKDKDLIIKTLLRLLKDGDPGEWVRYLIKSSRGNGYDYPEFKTIEKSLG